MNERDRYTFSVKAAAAYLGVAISTLYGIAERGEIDHLRTRGSLATRVLRERQVRVSGRLKFSEAGLDSWIAAHRVPARVSTPARDAARRIEPLQLPARRKFAR